MPIARVTLQDPNRLVRYFDPATGRSTTAAREVTFTAYAPDRPGVYPVIVWSHGHAASAEPASGDGLTAQALANRGYIVILPTHLDSPTLYPAWLSNQFQLTTPAAAIHRVADLRLALDLVATIVDALGAYQGDMSAPIVGGFSHGAYAAALMVGMTAQRADHDLQLANIYGLRELTDSRVAAAVLLSPQGQLSPWADLSSVSWSGVQVPILTITGTRDEEAGGVGWTDRLDAFRYAGEAHISAVVYRDASHGDVGGATVWSALTTSIARVIDRFIVTGQVASPVHAGLTSGEAEPLIAQTFVRDRPGSTGQGFLSGGAASETLVGLASDDVVIGQGGGDALAGGRGADVFRYLESTDSIAGAYDNLYDFETGVDRIDLAAVRPTEVSVIGSQGSSFVFVSTPTGAMLIVAAGRIVQASDINHGGNFGVYVIGSRAAETLVGSAWGGPIQAGDGDDVVIGGGGPDDLFGQVGADIYRYLAAADSPVHGSDRIFDFVSGADRIDLTAVRASDRDMFGIAYDAGGSFIFVDLLGDGVTDMLIQVIGAVSASDLIWSPFAKLDDDLTPSPGPVVDGAPADLTDWWF